jgi:addiction module HigA family antidote
MGITKQGSPERCPTHPGAFLREIVLPAIRANKVEIAAALGISRQSLYGILAEKQPVTPATAVRLGAVFWHVGGVVAEDAGRL